MTTPDDDDTSGTEPLHDMGGDIGPTPSGARGGGGLGPSDVREELARNDRLDREDGDPQAGG